MCTPDYLLEIGLEFEDGTDFEGDPQSQTIGLAAQVLEKLDRSAPVRLGIRLGDRRSRPLPAAVPEAEHEQ